MPFTLVETCKKPPEELPNQWKDKLAKAVNQEGKETSFSDSITPREHFETAPFKFPERN
jgi:hypothetical protein